MPETDAAPVLVACVDLDDATAGLVVPARTDGRRYGAARVLVRLHGAPLGEVALAPLPGDGHVPRAALDAAVHEQLGAVVADHLRADGDLAPDAPAPCTWQARLAAVRADPPLASVVLATCRRPERLARTLATLAAQTYQNLEVLVVDNCPSHPGAAEAVAALGDSRFRLLTEPTPGLSRARNLGLRRASGDVVALTDDDVDLDPDWVGNMVTPFYEDPGLGCVTGLIMPAQLESEQEQLFEQFGGFAKGFSDRTFALDDADRGPLYPYNAGGFGSGANMACRRTTFLAFGGFALDLGVATPARGGEDLDTYLSVLHSGQRLRYEPRGLVWHELRSHPGMLARQVYSYGIGMSAMITKRVVASPAERRRVLRALPAAVRYVLSNDSAKNAAKGPQYPRRLTLIELVGLLYGPLAYHRSRRRLARSPDR